MISLNKTQNHHLSLLLALSGIFGFCLGMTRFACWQAAVEGAQVLAGIVHYPVTNPFYIYQIKAWTLLHQLPALGLHVGMTEQNLSIFLCGITGLLAFQALSLSVYIFCRNIWLSLVFSWFIFSTEVYAFGVNYQIPFLGGTGTYGQIGFSFLFFAIAMLGIGRIRFGAFCLGLCPAVHAGLGILGILTVLLAGTSEWKENESFRKYFFPFLGIGLMLCLISFAWQWPLMHSIPSSDPVLARRCLEAFVKIWDGHRQPIPLRSMGVAINGTVLVLSSFLLKSCRKDFEPAVSLMLRIYQAAAVLSLIFSAISRLPIAWIPSWFLTLMAPRLLNVAIFGFPGFLIGIWIRYQEKPWTPLLALWVLLLPDEKIALLFFVLLAGLHLARRKEIDWRLFQKNKFWVAGITTVFILFGVFLRSGVMKVFHVQSVREEWANWRTDPFFKRVSQGQGLLLLSSDLGMKQLVTRRPVLLDMAALDALAYAPEAGPEMFRIMKEVYGVDLFLRPKGVDGTRSLPDEMIREVWANRGLEEWKKIRHDFGVTQVLASKITTTQLPKIGFNDEYDLYEIPE